MSMSPLPVSLTLGLILSSVEANPGSETAPKVSRSSTDDFGVTHTAWATLPMNVVPYLSAAEYVPATVPALVGTPPQEINFTVDVGTGFLAAYGTDCILCAGTTLFDSSLSSTFKTKNSPWKVAPSFSGVKASDTIGFGGLFSVTDQPFVKILDGSDKSFSTFIWNGNLGLFINPLSTSAIESHLLTRLYKSSPLLNPVVGMRFDPSNPKITIGALDPNDYEGTINWVQLDRSPDLNSGQNDTFHFDGVKGYDGQFVPYNGSLSAVLDSGSLSVWVPDAEVYFNNTNSTGPIPMPIGILSGFNVFEYNCSKGHIPQSPYVALTATINGVDYPLDSPGNLLRPQSAASSIGHCPVGIKTMKSKTGPSMILGLPFLRSVYVAYRFPTDNCPGYYGFAFPSGANRTKMQIAQQPTSTPPNSAQCLSLAAPTSTPTAKVALAHELLVAQGMYAVYGGQGGNQKPLVGVDDLPKVVWNRTGLQ